MLLAPEPAGSELKVLAVLAPGKSSRYLLDRRQRSYGTRQSLLRHLFYSFARPESLNCEEYVNIYTHI